MSLPRDFLTLVLAAAASLLLGLQLHANADSPPAGPTVMGVAWEERPDSVDELDALSTVAVEAEVTGVSAGAPLPPDDPNDTSDANQLPTQRIHFRTIDVLDGHIADTFDLFKTGSADTYLKNDPPYAVGQRYVLLLRPRQNDPGVFLPAAPDGRLTLDDNNHVDGTIPGPVDQDLQGETPHQVEAELGH